MWFSGYVKKKGKKAKAVPLHAMEALGGERRYSSYSFSTWALDGGEWSASRPGRAFIPGERTSGTHYTGGWVGPRAGLDTEARGKIICTRRGSNPDRPIVQPIVKHYTAWANPAPFRIYSNYKWYERNLCIASVEKAEGNRRSRLWWIILRWVLKKQCEGVVYKYNWSFNGVSKSLSTLLHAGR
jgi:hypothetical protein